MLCHAHCDDCCLGDSGNFLWTYTMTLIGCLRNVLNKGVLLWLNADGSKMSFISISVQKKIFKTGAISV
jgi:hypothetical protein